MRKFSLFGISIWLLMACAPADSKVVANDFTNSVAVNDSTPLLVLRSFFNRNENVSVEEIKEGVLSGKVVCTADVAGKIQRVLHIDHAVRVMDLASFPYTDTLFYVLTTIDSVRPSVLLTEVNDAHFLRDRTNYPLWIPDSVCRKWDSSITSYTHTGVTALTRRTGSILNTIGNEKYLELIRPALGNPDLLHVSNEVSMLDNCDYSSMKMKFATRPEHLDIVRLLGVDIVELTGNHNLDMGEEPYEATMNWYKSQGVKTFGGGLSPQEAAAPLVLSLKDGKKVAWIGFNEFCPCGECADQNMGANRYKEEKAKSSIAELRNEVDYIIACVQFGETDSYVPSSSQMKISKYLIDAGADVVIGSQAHQPQTFEYYHGKMIFYGIGNFMFDQIHRLGVRQAYYLECFFYNGKIIQFIPHFTYMGDDRRPAPANREQADAIRKEVYLPNYFLGKY